MWEGRFRYVHVREVVRFLEVLRHFRYVHVREVVRFLGYVHVSEVVRFIWFVEVREEVRFLGFDLRRHLGRVTALVGTVSFLVADVARFDVRAVVDDVSFLVAVVADSHVVNRLFLGRAEYWLVFF